MLIQTNPVNPVKLTLFDETLRTGVNFIFGVGGVQIYSALIVVRLQSLALQIVAIAVFEIFRTIGRQIHARIVSID